MEENRLVISASRHNSDSSIRAVRILEQGEGESFMGVDRWKEESASFFCRALERTRGYATPDSPFRAACFDTPPIHRLRFVGRRHRRN